MIGQLIKQHWMHIGMNALIGVQGYGMARGEGQSVAQATGSAIKELAMFTIFPTYTIVAPLMTLPVAAFTGVQNQVYAASTIQRMKMYTTMGSGNVDYRNSAGLRQRAMEQIRVTSMLAGAQIGNEAAIMHRQYG